MHPEHPFDAPDGARASSATPASATPASATPTSVRREPLRPGWHAWLGAGLHTAAIAAAATAGVLVRFGLASGDGALGAFTQVGRLAAGITRADGAMAHVAAAVVGLALHVVVVAAWSLAYARVASGWGTIGRWLAAGAVAGIAWLAGAFVLPPMLRLGHGVRALPPQVLLLHVVLALALAIGMRLALEAVDEL